METSYLQSIYDDCRILKLGGVKGSLSVLLEDAVTQKWSHDRFLAELLGREVEYKEKAHIRALISKAHFPQLKYLEDLDRSELPKDMAVALPELETLDFIRESQNVIMYGNPGTGKTHSAIGLGIKACMAGYNVLYASVPRLLVEIKETESQRKLSRSPSTRKVQRHFSTSYRSVQVSSPSSLPPTLASTNGTKSSPTRSLPPPL